MHTLAILDVMTGLNIAKVSKLDPEVIAGDYVASLSGLPEYEREC